MKKRLFLLLLVVVLAFSALYAPAFANDICFIAINENLLELTSMPAVVGSTVYVPHWVFDSFRIYYTFFSSDNIAMVYTAEKQFYFEMESGNTYDGDDNIHSTRAIYRNGVVYLPAKFICNQFGLRYSYIPSEGHGDIVRICDSSAVLSDERFISAASILMDAYYNAYAGLAASPSPTPGGQPPAGPGTGPNNEPDRRDTEILLSFIGLPSDALLSALDSRGIPVCFFLSAEDLRTAPDMARRLVGSVHSVGILLGEQPETDFAETSELLFDAARILPLLVAAAPEADADACRTMATEQGLAFLDCDIDAVNEGKGVASAAVVTSQIEFSTERVSVHFACGGSTEEILPGVLQYLIQNRFSVRAPRETDAAS